MSVNNCSCQVHGAAEATSVARLENVPPQPYRRDRRDLSWFRRSHSSYCTDFKHSRSTADEFFGSASHHRQPPTGSPRQVSEARGWEPVPDYLVRDRDRVYGEAFTRRIRATGIRDRPTAPRSPWQNGYAERLIGSIRRECLDHVIVFGERHLRHVLRSYQQYYNGTRTHLALAKDLPLTRSVQAIGSILPLPILGGLHHHYVRISISQHGHPGWLALGTVSSAGAGCRSGPLSLPLPDDAQRAARRSCVSTPCASWCSRCRSRVSPRPKRSLGHRSVDACGGRCFGSHNGGAATERAANARLLKPANAG